MASVRLGVSVFTGIDEVLNTYSELENRPSGFPAKLLKARKVPVHFGCPMLGLPNDYLKFVEKYSVEGVSVGMLELMPIPANDIVSALQAINGVDKIPYIPNNMVHVANFEGDLILVIKGENRHENSGVYFYDISSGKNHDPQLIANCFTDFITISANLDTAALQGNNMTAELFVNAVCKIDPTLSENPIVTWKHIFDMYA